MLATIGIGLRTNPEDVPQSNRHAKLLHQHLPSRRAALRSAIQTRRNKQIARKSATHQRPIVRDHSLFRTQRTNQSTRKKKEKTRVLTIYYSTIGGSGRRRNRAYTRRGRLTYLKSQTRRLSPLSLQVKQNSSASAASSLSCLFLPVPMPPSPRRAAAREGNRPGLKPPTKTLRRTSRYTSRPRSLSGAAPQRKTAGGEGGLVGGGNGGVGSGWSGRGFCRAL